MVTVVCCLVVSWWMSFVVVCNLLFVRFCFNVLLVVGCCVLCVVCIGCSLFVGSWLLVVCCWLLLVVCCLRVVRWLSCVVLCSSFVVCCLQLFVDFCVLCVVVWCWL